MNHRVGAQRGRDDRSRLCSRRPWVMVRTPSRLHLFPSADFYLISISTRGFAFARDDRDRFEGWPMKAAFRLTLALIATFGASGCRTAGLIAVGSADAGGRPRAQAVVPSRRVHRRAQPERRTDRESEVEGVDHGDDGVARDGRGRDLRRQRPAVDAPPQGTSSSNCTSYSDTVADIGSNKDRFWFWLGRFAMQRRRTARLLLRLRRPAHDQPGRHVPARLDRRRPRPEADHRRRSRLGSGDSRADGQGTPS